MTATVDPPNVGTVPAPRAAMGRWSLRAVVLVAGMTTMATEMAASRLLQPFFGASVVVWANIIGLILIYLSVGYWYGGRVADRHPHARGLSLVTLGAAVTIAVVPFVARPILDIAAGGVESFEVGAVLGSFAGCLLLFAVPITLLGMVPPYAVRLALHDVDHSGQVAGSLYALSTIGSIIGTFGSVLVTIPAIGTRLTMLSFALALALLSVVGFRQGGGWKGLRVPAAATTFIAALMLVPVGLVKASSTGTVIFEQESRYQYVQVVQDDAGRRLLHLNEGWAVHSVYDPQTVLTGGIWDHFLVLPAFAGQSTADAQGATYDFLVIGNAAGSAARIYDVYRPNTTVTGVEIDPLVTDVGYRYFHMRDAQNLTVHAADGRPFLAGTRERWDVVHIDAYRQPYIPFYLTTREFFELTKARLADGGVLAINVGSDPRDNRIQEAVAATMRSVYPSVFRYQAEDYNEVIVATRERTTLEQARQRLRGSELARNPDVDHLFADFADGLFEVRPDPDAVLTDDRAPVEWMTDRMIVGAASGG